MRSLAGAAALLVSALALAVLPAVALAGTFPGTNGRIAVTAGSQIKTVLPDGSMPLTLTSTGTNVSPAWSPDGQRIAFLSNRSGSTDVWVMAADGSNPVQMTFDSSIESVPTWTADGGAIAFFDSGVSGEGLYTVPATGGSESFYRADTGGAQFSVGGSILFSALYEKETTAIQAVFSAVGAGAATRLTGDDGLAAVPGSWSPDGAAIAYKKCPASCVDRDVYRANANGSGATNLTNTKSVEETDPFFSPDGTLIAYGRGASIWVMSAADGSGQKSVTSGTEPDWQPLGGAPPPGPGPGPGPDPTPPGKPSNRISIRAKVALGGGGTTATLTIDAPGPGRLLASSRKGGKKPVLKPLSLPVKAKGAVRAKLTLSAAGKSALRSRGTLTVPVTVTFTPSGGDAAKLSRSVVFKLPRGSAGGR